MSEQHSYFADDIVTIAGATVRTVAPQASGLSRVERCCCEHIDNLMWQIRQHTRERFWLYLLPDAVPDASAFSESLESVGQIRITTGLLSAICLLAARAAIVIVDKGFLLGWLPSFKGDATEEATKIDVLAPFDLPKAKAEASGLDAAVIDEINVRLQRDPIVLINTLKVACAALEFAVFHEMGHFDAGHDESRRIQRSPDAAHYGSFRPSLDVQRVFEHQADIFALRLMIALAPVRPHVENPEPWHERLRQENNIVSYIAASLNFALATMLRSNEPGVKKDIRLIRSVRGEHPLPTTRLTIADRQVRIELDDPEIRDRLWPNAPDQASIILQGMVFHATFLALDTISRSWRDGVDQSRTGALAPNLEYALRDDDLNESLEYLNATNLEKASAVMFATGLHGKRSLRNRLNSLAWMIRSWGSTIFSRIGLGKKGEFHRDYPCEVEMVIPPTGAGVDLEAMRTIAQRFDHSEQTSAELGMGTIRWRFKTSEDAAAFLEAIARSQSTEVKE